MSPVLFQWGPVDVPTFGALLVLGCLLGAWQAIRGANRYGLDAAAMTDLVFYVTAFAFVGARIWFVLDFADDYGNNLWQVVRIWDGGLDLWGAAVFGLPVAIIYALIRGMPLGDAFDAIAPGLALGQAAGWIGLFTSGECFGTPSTASWAVPLTDALSHAPLDVSFHPTQIYTALAMLLIFFFLTVLSLIRKFPGQIFWTYALLHSLYLLFIEPYFFVLQKIEAAPGLTFFGAAAALSSFASLFMLSVLSHRRRVRYYS